MNLLEHVFESVIQNNNKQMYTKCKLSCEPPGAAVHLGKQAVECFIFALSTYTNNKLIKVLARGIGILYFIIFITFQKQQNESSFAYFVLNASSYVQSTYTSMYVYRCLALATTRSEIRFLHRTGVCIDIFMSFSLKQSQE